MLQVWDYAFVPATALAGVGVAVLALAWVGPTHWGQWLTGALVIATVSAVGMWVFRRARIPLGVND
jgi:hypothetical protein